MNTNLIPFLAATALLACAPFSHGQGTASNTAEVFPVWRQSGSMFILTTPDLPNFPASAEVRDFPLPGRLHRDPLSVCRGPGGWR